LGAGDNIFKEVIKVASQDATEFSNWEAAHQKTAREREEVTNFRTGDRERN